MKPSQIERLRATAGREQDRLQLRADIKTKKAVITRQLKDGAARVYELQFEVRKLERQLAQAENAERKLNQLKPTNQRRELI